MFTVQIYILSCIMSKGKTRKDAGEIPKDVQGRQKMGLILKTYSHFPLFNQVFCTIFAQSNVIRK